MDKESVYRYYGWRIEDGDYSPKDTHCFGSTKTSRFEKFINLLISIFVMRFK